MSDNKKYRPSSGGEGDWFMRKFCYQCRNFERRVDQYCKIIPATMFVEIDDPNYPPEWIYDNNRSPVCTKFSDKRLKLIIKPRVKKIKGQGMLFIL